MGGGSHPRSVTSLVGKGSGTRCDFPLVEQILGPVRKLLVNTTAGVPLPPLVIIVPCWPLLSLRDGMAGEDCFLFPSFGNWHGALW